MEGVVGLLGIGFPMPTIAPKIKALAMEICIRITAHRLKMTINMTRVSLSSRGEFRTADGMNAKIAAAVTATRRAARGL